MGQSDPVRAQLRTSSTFATTKPFWVTPCDRSAIDHSHSSAPFFHS